MSAKDRAKIYRQAAELIADHKSYFSCWAIEEVVGKYPYEESYPEFWMFKFQSDGDALWWHGEPRNTIREYRILALLLSEQIALNP